MIQSVFGKLKAAFAFFRPRVAADIYAFRIWRSSHFDKDFYLGVNQGLNFIYRTFPIRHFVRFGENEGRQPNPEFSPDAYRRLNPDLERLPQPFLHYIRFGHDEFRSINGFEVDLPSTDTPLPSLRSLFGRTSGQRSKYAIHVHVFYHEVWADFSSKLNDVDVDIDVYVTIINFGDKSIELRDEILAEHPDAVVVLMPNHGRDIFPFVYLVNSGVFAGYDAVCKIHTKKSPHRKDGAEWRDHLVDGLLRGNDTRRYLDAFTNDTSASVWVADCQHYDDEKWWSTNFDKTSDLLRRAEIFARREHLSFPAGSMYWLKPEVLDTIRGLSLTEFDFDREAGQVDSTLAHAFERGLGYIAEDGGRRIVQTSMLETPRPSAEITSKPAFVSAFYLPQFHRTKENDAWWGSGFSEWVAATGAGRNFFEHHQPQLPSTLGFYDLRNTDVMAEQAQLAKSAGIDALCTYFYWFDEQRILEEPIDNLLKTPDIDFPFYLCWANESWRRNWDGLSGEVLLDQGYLDGFEEKLARDTARYMRDPRYQRPDGVRPRFMIYRPDDLPDPKKSVEALREAWRAEGIGEVELGAVIFHVTGENEVPDELFDFWVEMPPHGLVPSKDYLFGGPAQDSGIDLRPRPGFTGLVYDYRSVAKNSTDPEYVESLPQNAIVGAMPSWDNTARRGCAAHIAWGANPMTFDAWLEDICTRRIKGSYREELFINAWNEWAEKAMLEPSRQYGDAYLRVLSKWI